MALVKKLQPGGTIDQNAVREKAGKYLEELNLSSKDARKAVAAFDKLSAYLSTPGGGKSFSVDPLTNTYKVTGPGSEAFQGNTEEMHRGFFSGNLKIKNPMSVAALLYNKALNEVKGSTTTTTAATNKSDINIGDLGDYVKNTIYGGSAAGAAYDIHKLTSDKERQAKTLEFANKYIADYLSRAEINKESFNATDIDKVKELQSSIKSGNWEDFRMKAYALKWNPEEFLLSDQEKQNIKEEDATKKLQDTTSAFTKAGINADVQEGLYKSGYTDLVNDWTPQGIDSNWFKNLLTKNNVATVYNPTTKKHQLVSGSKYFDYAENDRFSPYYGYSLKNDENGGVHAYNPAQSLKENVGAFGTPDQNENVLRRIYTDLPGEVWGSSGDVAGKYATDVLGRRDYTKKLIYKHDGIQTVLTKGTDGKYRNDAGIEFPIKMTGYGTEVRPILADYAEQRNQAYLDPNDVWSDVRPEKRYTSLKILEDQLTNPNTGQEALSLRGGADNKIVTNMISHLRWVLKNSLNPEERNQAQSLYSRIREWSSKSEDIRPDSGSFYKDGGRILKGKKGMTTAEYIKKYSSPSRLKDAPALSSASKPISSSGRLGGMDAFEVASLAGTALSFIPGIGAIGGGITTIADIAHDIKKDGFQAGDIFNSNTAANLGFTALSLFGAGGVKALVIGAKAAKVGKAADLGFDIGRAAQKASALEAKALKLGLEVPETIKRAKNLATLDKMVSTETLKAVSKTDDIAKIVFKEGEKDALRSAGYVDESGKLIKSSTGENLLQTDLGSAFGISKASLTGVEGFSKQYLKEPIWESAKFLGTQGSKLAKSKLVGKTATLGMISAGGLGAYNIGQEMLDAPEGTSIGDRVSRIKTSDLKNALIAGSLTKNWYSGAKNAKALLNQTEAKTLKDAERSITVGDKEFKVSDKVELPKVSKLSFKKDDVKQVQKLKSDLKAKLIGTDAEKEEAIKLIMKDDKLPTSITNNLVEGTSGERMLKSEINDRFSDSGRSIREYARAKKIIERQITSPGQLRARWKASKIAEAPVHPKAPKAVVEEVVHVEPPKVTATPPSKSVKKKEIKPGEFYGSLFKSGGVLKLLNGGKGSRTAPIHQLPEVVKTAKKLPSPTGSNKINIAPELAKLKQQANSMPALKQPEIPKIASTGILPNDKKSGWLTDESGKLKLPKFDTTDVTNALMYINTTQANKAIGRAQSNAAISGLYTLPYMSKQYQRISDPYSTLGTTEATKVQSKAGRLASTTSDIDKSIATNLEGTRQAADIRAKYNLAGVDRLDKLRQQQSTSDFRIDAANTETLAKNRAMFAGTAQKLELIGANEIGAQNAALNNFMTSLHRNQSTKEYKAGQQELLAAYKKPSLLAASEEYKKALSEETQQYYLDLYNKKVKNMPEYGAIPWESSAEAKQLQSLQKAAKDRLDLEYKPITNLQVAQQYRSPYFKQGGSISLEDKVKLERYKEAVKRNNKEVELAYKTIKENNEMLQKALIKVFK